MTLQLAVLASGNGSNLQAILDRIASGALDARVCLVLCNKPEARALTRARAAGVAHLVLAPADHLDRESFDAAMVAAIRAHGADTVALAGYMRLLTPGFLAAFPGRVVNIHPALLPSFPGLRGAADARDYGVTLAGCTVHFVDEQMDHGAVIVQAAVPVNPGEPLDGGPGRAGAAARGRHDRAGRARRAVAGLAAAGAGVLGWLGTVLFLVARTRCQRNPSFWAGRRWRAIFPAHVRQYAPRENHAPPCPATKTRNSLHRVRTSHPRRKDRRGV